MKTILELKNVSVGFGQKELVKAISTTIRESEIVALMGINGIGKSCLLKTLIGINPLISGDIILNEVSLKYLSPEKRALSLSAVLTQKPLMDFMRVDELVALGRSPHLDHWGHLKENDQKIIDESLALLGINQLKEHSFENLSDGQQQKVLLARALAQEPSLLILDEPTTYLDIPSKIELMKSLKKIAHEKKMAILLSSHDLDLMSIYVDTIWLIEKDGSLISKCPEEMKSSGLLQKNFNLKFEPV